MKTLLVCLSHSPNCLSAFWRCIFNDSWTAKCIFVRRGGSLVDSSSFVWRVVGSNPALFATYGPRASPSLTVASGASAWNSDIVSVLCQERPWVVVDLKRRYRNCLIDWLNDWMNDWMNKWMNEWMNEWVRAYSGRVFQEKGPIDEMTQRARFYGRKRGICIASQADERSDRWPVWLETGAYGSMTYI